MYYFCNYFLQIMNIKTLKNIGLSEIEAKIYISLLEIGSQNITQIAESSSCNRVQIYGAIPRLKEKRLIGETIRWKRKFFFAENPENLENIFYEQKLIFQSSIAAMKEKYKKKQSKPELKTFYTEEDISHIYQDVVESLDVGGCYYRYSSRTTEYKKWTLYKQYRKNREKKEIQRMVITGHELKKLKEDKQKNLTREMVAIPKKYDLFEDDITKLIYANKVAILDHSTKTSFIIENQKFADFEKKIFKLLFKYLRKN